MIDLEAIDVKLLFLQNGFETVKEKLPTEDMNLIDSYFKKVRAGISNLKEGNYSFPEQEEAEFVSVKIFMNKIYELIKKGD